jgi:hypothetical protein
MKLPEGSFAMRRTVPARTAISNFLRTLWSMTMFGGRNTSTWRLTGVDIQMPSSRRLKSATSSVRIVTRYGRT